MATLPQTFFVYVLARPNGKPFYVGKGSGRRIYDHEVEARRNCHCKKCNTIRKVWREGGEVQRFIIFTTNDEAEAFAYEIETIALYGRKNLCNLSDGGEGPSNPPPEVRAKMRDAKLGKRQSESHRAATAAAQTGRKATPETRAKVSAGIKARYAADPVYRASVLARIQKQAADPVLQAKHRASVKAAMSTPEGRAKNSASKKALYADNPAQHEKLSASLRLAWANPERRAKASATQKIAARLRPKPTTPRSAESRELSRIAAKAAAERRKAAKDKESL